MAINYLENTESWSYVWVSFIGLSCCVVKDADEAEQLFGKLSLRILLWPLKTILMNGITGVCVGRCMVCTNPSHHAAFNTLYGGTATIARNTCEGPGFNSGICE